LIIFFTFPETKGKTELELAALFGDHKLDHEYPVTLNGLEAGMEGVSEPYKEGIIVTEEKGSTLQ
jgi:hypothetical protein